MSQYTEIILKNATEADLNMTKAELLTTKEILALAEINIEEPPIDFDIKAEMAFLADYLKPVDVVNETILDNGEIAIIVKHNYLGTFTIYTANQPEFPRLPLVARVSAETKEQIITLETTLRLKEDAKQRFDGTHLPSSLSASTMPTYEEIKQWSTKDLAEFQEKV